MPKLPKKKSRLEIVSPKIASKVKSAKKILKGLGRLTTGDLAIMMPEKTFRQRREKNEIMLKIASGDIKDNISLAKATQFKKFADTAKKLLTKAFN